MFKVFHIKEPFLEAPAVFEVRMNQLAELIIANKIRVMINLPVKDTVRCNGAAIFKRLVCL